MGLFTTNDTTNEFSAQNVSGASPLLMGEEKKERILCGYLGALVFSLGGAVVYFLLYQLDFIAGISGLVSVLLASLGYRLFSGKKNSKHSVIASVIMLVISIALAEFFCLAFACYQSANEIRTFTFGESMKFLPEILENKELQSAIVKEMLIAYGLGALCAFGVLRKNYRACKEPSGTVNAADNAADNASVNAADNNGWE